MFPVLLLILLCVCLNVNSLFSYIEIDINGSNHKNFKHFWKSTGFCPPDPKVRVSEYLLSNEQQTHLGLIGSLPNKGIKYVRIHWLLNLLTSYRNIRNELVYNFTDMDKLMKIINKNGLYPGFEIMGCKNDLVDFDKTKTFWSTLAENISKRYTDTFGTKIISKWRFESWNEPDLKNYNCLNFTLSEYLDYITGCNEGLKSAFSTLKSTYNFGGPAGMFRDKNHPLCWGILEFCSASVDLCPLKYISFHRKGGGSAEGVLNGSLAVMDDIFRKFPRLKTIPISNDEADIERDWSLPREWRGDVRYAYMLVKVIADYYTSVKIERGLKVELLGNDNGFINYHPFYFTQRTLFVRFQMNTTTPPHSQFIKKPVYSLMALLSFLGESWIPTPVHPTSPDPLLTIIATRSAKQHEQTFVSVILAYGNETHEDNLQENSGAVSLKISGLDDKDQRFVVYKLDNIDTNPYKIWKEMKSPVFPDREQRSKMRQVEAPVMVIPPTAVIDSVLLINLTLNIPSVHLIQVCSKKNSLPKKVRSLMFYNVTWNEVLITWKYPYDDSKCILRYEMEFEPSKCGTVSDGNSSRRRFERLNTLETVFMSFHRVGKGSSKSCERTRGTYRVRAVDYWNIAGKFSEISPYP